MQLPEGVEVEARNSRTVVMKFDELSRNPHRPDVIEMRFDKQLSGRPVAITLRVQDGLRPSDVRRLPWKMWFWAADVALRELKTDSETVEVESFHIMMADEEGAPTEPALRRPGRRGHPDQHYRDIAVQYQQLVAAGAHNPTERLAKQRHVTRGTAAGWVRGARQRGYLPPARRGRAG